jgi:O-antigen/teichoic acid export membrane protein
VVKAKIIKDTAMLNIAGIISQILGIGQRLLILRFLDPALYGVWLGLSILLSYAVYTHLGLEHGMGVRLPYYRAREDARKQAEIESAVFTAWTAFACVLACGVVIYALVSPGSPLKRWGLCAIAVMIPLEQQNQFFLRWYTSAHFDFMIPSRMGLLRSALLVLVVVPLTALFGIGGLISGNVIVSAVIVIVWHTRGKFPVLLRPSGETLKELFRVGFPILLVVVVGGLIDSIDRVLILFALSTVSLGYYGITGLGGNSVYGFLAQAGSAMAPHMAADMGRSGDSPASLERYLIKPTLYFGTAAACLTLSLFFVIPPLVRRLIPQFVPGIPAFYAYVPGFFFLAIIITANNVVNLVLIARKRQRMFFGVQVISLLCEVGLGLLFIRLGWGIVGVAAASTLAYAVYGCTTLLLACLFVLTPGATVRFMAAALMPILYCGALAAAILSTTASWTAGPIVFAGVQLAAYAVGCLPLLFWLNRRAPFVDDVRVFWRGRRAFVAGATGAS